MQAIPGHEFPPPGKATYTTIHAVHRQRLRLPGSAGQRDTDNTISFLPFSYSGAHMTFNDRLEYSCLDDNGAWSSVDKQYIDPAPQSVAVQSDEQCDTMSHSERVILARTFLSDKLPATDSLILRTVPRLSALAQVDYTVLVSPQPGFQFSEAMINHFQKIQLEFKNLRWANHTNLLRYFAPEALHPLLELSSTGFLF